MINKVNSSVLIFLTTFPLICLSQAKEVKCKIEINTYEHAIFKGDCLIHIEQGGTFTLWKKESSKPNPILGEMSTLTVFVTEKNQALVSGMTNECIQNSWGSATRSNSEPGCWIGQNFEICAWRK